MAYFARTAPLLLILCCCTHCLALSEGAVGSSSLATAEISLTIPEHLALHPVKDFESHSSTKRRTIATQQNVTISRNDNLEAQIYQVVFLGSGSGGAFTLANTTMPAAPQLTYSLEFNDEPQPGGIRVRSGFPLSSQVGLHSSSNATIPNANISWQIPNSVLRNAPPGIYSGTVVVLVLPE